MSLFVAGAIFGEIQVSLFVAGALLRALFGEVQASLFVAGAVFEAQLSLFVAGAAFGEIWNDSPSAKCCIFQKKMLVVSAENNLGCEAGCGLTVSFSNLAQILLGSWPDRPRIVNDISTASHFSWQVQYLVML